MAPDTTDTGDAAPIHIHYHRPPDRDQVFVQRLVRRRPDAVVTYMDRTPLPAPLSIDGDVILEDGSPAVWFTFPDRWHDIGRFHRADGTFTGLYANILTPVSFAGDTTWRTTDLFLDLWLPPGGHPVLLDRDEFDEARDRGWIDEDTADRAMREAERLLASARAGQWPPPIVGAWPLERVRRHLGGQT